MPNFIIAEGKTSTEAIENGLKQLKVSKDKVDIKILENEAKKSFFSILTPRIVKVQLTLKENNAVPVEEAHKHIEKVNCIEEKDLENSKKELITFLNDFTKSVTNLEYTVSTDNEYIYINITGENAGNLIGYRGETLNSLQTILTAIANKNVESRMHLILDIENYREKRKNTLEDLSEKLAKTVVKTGKQVSLEPMSAYERKIIHNQLQNNNLVKTYSIGEEPYRKVVIAKK